MVSIRSNNAANGHQLERVSFREEDKPPVIEGKRVCTEKGCNVVLSRYNEKQTCWQHTPVEFGKSRYKGISRKPGGGRKPKGNIK